MLEGELVDRLEVKPDRDAPGHFIVGHPDGHAYRTSREHCSCKVGSAGTPCGPASPGSGSAPSAPGSPLAPAGMPVTLPTYSTVNVRGSNDSKYSGETV